MTDIAVTLRPQQGIQCEENILYLFDPNVVVSIAETTTRQWLDTESQNYINTYIKPILDAYEEEKEREIDDYVEEKQSTIFFDNTNFTGITTAETLNITGATTIGDKLTTVGDIILENEENERHIKFKKSNDDAIRGLITNRYVPNSLVTLSFSSLYNTGKSAQMTMIAGENIKSDISVIAEQNDRATGETDIHKRTVATQGWVNNPEKSLNVVHRSGDETINDEKTFYSDRLIKKTNIDFSVTPANPFYTEIRNIDKNNKEIGQFRCWKDTDGANHIDLLARYQDNDVNFYGGVLGLRIYSNGKTISYVQDPDSNANGNEIATCSWVKNLFDAQANSSYVSGWFKYNGLKICYGQPGNGVSNGQFVTIPITFSSSKWVVIPICLSTNGNINVSVKNDGQTTGFYVYHNHSDPITIMYIAIGY